MRLSTIEKFQKRYFEAGSEPCARTVRRGIERGDIPGRKIGGTWYVDLHLFEATDDPLVARVLSGDDGRPSK